jgi:hypothetical protein
MQFDSVLDLKNEFLSKNYQDDLQVSALQDDDSQGKDFQFSFHLQTWGQKTTSLTQQPLLKRYFGFGYIAHSKNDYELDLRLQNPDRKMYTEAEKFRDERAKGEARIAVMKNVKIPSKNTLLRSGSGGHGHPQLIVKKRPLHIGLSLCHMHGAPGTLGAFVLTSEHDTAILSNNHILGLLGQAHINDLIFQPSALDTKYVLNDYCIGHFKKRVEISRIADNKVDAAYATLNDGISHEGNLLPKELGIPDQGKRITEVADPVDPNVLVSNSTVAKIGRKSGYTSVSGTSDKPLVAVTNTIVNFPGAGDTCFCDIIEIPWESNSCPFSQDGDSGSLVFLPGSLSAIGLLFAKGERTNYPTGEKQSVSYACNLLSVLKALQLTLVA